MYDFKGPVGVIPVRKFIFLATQKFSLTFLLCHCNHNGS